MINETHDANLKSWVSSANDPNTDFPIQNLPYCYFDRSGADGEGGIGVIIGDQVLDLTRCREDGLFAREDLADVVWTLQKGAAVSNLFDVEPVTLSALRARLVELLREDADEETRSKVAKNLIDDGDVRFDLPCEIGDYTDFYCSIYHATNVGMLFRPDNPLLSNYNWVPIGYHGRASSIVVSGTDVIRPKGQGRPDPEAPPVFGPSRRLDYEMEVGFFVGKGNELGDTIPADEAEDHIFGLCLVNDWSARDIQGWEYQPLGPFLGKSFATTISPAVVTMEALAPFRVPAFDRGDDYPAPLPYLSDDANAESGGIDLKLDVFIRTKKMRNEGIEPHLISRSNLKDLFWTIGQMLTHHASNGCNLQTGDLIASGTVSGKEESERGCLLEMTRGGKEPIELPTGEMRAFLEDYDEIIMRGFCEREGFRRIGFGECRGIVVPVVE
jgi:fumarylacetoacetase